MKSMTGFGKSVKVTDAYQVEVDMKAVNHRFLDVQLRMPRECNELELPLKKMIKKTVNRGRIDCFITIQKDLDSFKDIKIHWRLLDKVVDELTRAQEERYGDTPVSVADFLSGVVQQETFFEVVDKQIATDDFFQTVLAACSEALAKLDDSRQAEGEEIRKFLVDYAEQLRIYTDDVRACHAEFEAEYEEKLRQKVTDLLGGELDEVRLLTEVTLMLEKGDIHEELDRLAIHLASLAKMTGSDKPIGKEMDFLIQEINREINTIGSKTTLIAIKERVVKMKTTLEKIREQIQNVE